MENIKELRSIWPEWQIDEKPLGRGSYGVVYKATRNDHGVESNAAIKVVSIPQNESELESLRSEGLSENDSKTYLQGVVDDFVSEIQLMESFKGVQNIVSVEDYKVVERQDGIGWNIYIRMELLTPFSRYIADRILSEQEVIRLGVDMCTALELCAQKNVIHRDIKPENIFVNQFGNFKLGDFGIARKLENATGGLSQKGTFGYMAPEVEKGSNYDGTVDIYSLGLVLYRLLNKNRLPFCDTNKPITPVEREAANRRRLDGEALPPPCNASPALADVVLCACEYDPAERFATPTAMKNVLQRLLTNKPNQNNNMGAGRANPAYNATQSRPTVSVNGANQGNRQGVQPQQRQGTQNRGYAANPNNRPVQNVRVENFDKPKKERKKLSKGKKAAIAAISSLVVLLALALTAVISYLKSDAHEVLTKLDAGKYESAVKQYKNHVVDSGIWEKVFGIALNKQYDSKLESFKSGKLKYEDALAYIDTIIDMDAIDGAEDKFAEVIEGRCNAIMDEFNAKTIKYEDAITELSALSSKEKARLKTTVAADKMELIRKLNAADTAYEKAEAQINAGNYEEAISQLSQIPEESSHYSDAQAKLGEAIKGYKNDVIEQANTHIVNGDYPRAISVIEYALNIIKDDAELTTKLGEIKTQHTDSVRNAALSQSTDLQSGGDYLGAMKVLKDAIKEVGSDAQLQSAYDACESKYVSKVKQEVESKLSTDWNAAKTLIDDAMAALPGNSTLTALLQTVNNAKPAKLYELTVVDSKRFNYIKNSIQEEVFTSYGERVEECILLSLGDWSNEQDSYVIYNMTGNYNTLNLTLAPRQGFSSSKICRVTILLDDEIAYDSEFVVTTAPQTVNLNVTGHTLVRIQVVKVDGRDNAGIIVYNAQLKK